jgi:carbon storage regulator
MVMLVLGRKLGERIVVPDREVVITVVAIEGNVVRLGVSAPASIAVDREEVRRRRPVATPPDGGGASGSGV